MSCGSSTIAASTGGSGNGGLLSVAGNALTGLGLGSDGLVSVAAHLCAREYRAMYEAFVRGDVRAAAAGHLELAPLVAALFATTSPIPVKWAMNELGFALGPCRSPLGRMPVDLAARLGPLLEPFRERARVPSTR